MINDILKTIKFPESLNKIKQINPKAIPLNLTARLKCFQCGLYKRGILCPPYVWKTYPQFETFKSTRKFINNYKSALIFIWKNDGSKSWKIIKSDLSHIQLKKKKGMQLKGTEAGQSREITRMMKKIQTTFKKKGYENAFSFIPGHCDLCAFKCPNRDNPPCKKNGLPSMESIGIDVYRLLEQLNIEYEYPVINELTNVTMLLT